MFFLVILFIVVPIAELYVIIQVGQAIGILPTLALLLADAILGSLLLKHQGAGAWRRFNEALAQKRFPGQEVADGLLIVIGGTLLLAPGFLTDIVGLFFLIPPTRAIARKLLKRFTIGRFTVVGMGAGGFPGSSRPSGSRPDPARPDGAPRRDYDYDVSAEEVPSNGDGAERRLPRSED